jgi:ATP-dependent Clp protease ATP-binding subunit ClpA
MTDRFDKFTERTRKTLQLAQEEAQRLNHNYVGTEHILLGLVREGDGVAARVLNNLGIDLSNVRSAVESIIGRGDQIVMGEVGLTSRAKRVIELALDEARRLNHHYVGTEHLLLGLVREGEGIAAGVLQSLGVSLAKVREQVLDVLSSSSGYGGRANPTASVSTEASGTGRFDKFTERARKTLQLAQEEAQRFNHNYIGTEHILLGLLKQPKSLAAQVLQSLGVPLESVRSAVEFIIGRGERMMMGEIGLTPRAKRVIELAVDEARRLNHHYIGTEHLLLGLVREGEGIASGVLESLRVSLAKVRAEVVKATSNRREYEAALLKASNKGSTEWYSGTEKREGSVSLEMLRTMFDYLIWARDQLLPLIQGLEEGKLKEVPAELQKSLYGSMHNTLAHMAQSEWL